MVSPLDFPKISSALSMLRSVHFYFYQVYNFLCNLTFFANGFKINIRRNNSVALCFSNCPCMSMSPVLIHVFM